MLTIGDLEGVRVAVFGAREHYYENGNPAAMRVPLAVLKALGATDLILTNAAGSMRSDIGPGDLMLLSDHINYNGLNPLIGEKTDARFVPLTDAHDPGLRAGLTAAAARLGIPLPEGVYCFCIKPTPFRPLSKKLHRQEHASVRSRRRGRHTLPFCAEPGGPIWKTRDGRKDRAHDSRTGLAWLASRRRDLFDRAGWPAVSAVYVAGWTSPTPNSNSVPSTHIRCINTACLRAKATLARFAPRRVTSRSAQAFRADGLTRSVMFAFAAS